MCSFFKTTFYDWHGLNAKISQYLHLSVDHHDLLGVFDFISKYIGNYKFFPLHLAVILVAMFLSIWLERRSLTKKQIHHKTLQFTHILITLFGSLVLLGILVLITKKALAFPRPICIEGFVLNSYTTLNKHTFFPEHKLLEECFMSTPSGHSAYITALVVSLWTLLPKSLRYLGIFLILATMQARVSLGMHFLSDILFGAASALLITLSSYKISGSLLKRFKISTN